MTFRAVKALAIAATALLPVSRCGSSGSSSTVTVTTSAAPAAPRPTRHALSFPALVAKVRSGVIRIETATCDGTGIGTGILLGPRLIATVDHVVAGASLIALKQNGKTLASGTVIGSDPARDIALVRSSRPIPGYRFRFATKPPTLGENVAAIGFPEGLPLTVTRGSVSGLDRTIPIDGIRRTQLVQTDAPVNPGNSGGPLMTDSGLVVGLVDLGTTQANGLAFAVNADVAAPLIQSWTIAPQPITDTNCTPAPTATPTPQSTSLSYNGPGFSINYPNGWIVSHIPEGGGNIDTTFQPPGGGGLLIRVDENPAGGNISPQAAAAPVIAALEKEPGYLDLGTSSETFAGLPAYRWEFEDTENGIQMHKLDEFFSAPGGPGWAILIQAPQQDWSNDANALERYVHTFAAA